MKISTKWNLIVGLSIIIWTLTIFVSNWFGIGLMGITGYACAKARTFEEEATKK